MLVFITEMAIKTPKKYAPLSPRNTLAFGKLYLRNVAKIIIKENIKKAKSLFPSK